MRTSWKRGAVTAATVALIAGLGGVASADEPEAPSEGGEAEATAAEVTVGGDEGVNGAIGETSARNNGTDESTAFAARLNDQGIGGSSSDDPNNGALMDTDEFNEEGQGGRVAVMPWSAEADEAESSSHAAALLVRVDDPDGNEGIYLEVLGSESTATDSSADARSDGILLRLGGDQLMLNVLHADASSDGTSEAYVLGVNDQTIITSQDADGQCALEIPEAGIALSCLTAQAISTAAAAQVLDGDVNPGDQAVLGLDLIGASSGSAPAEVEGTTFEPQPAPTDDTSRAPIDDVLAATGGSVGLAGLALLLIGLGAWAVSRERLGAMRHVSA